jgi:hypothetical protein
MEEFNIISGDKIRDKWENLFSDITRIFLLLKIKKDVSEGFYPNKFQNGFYESNKNIHLSLIEHVLYRGFYESNKNNHLSHENLLVQAFVLTLTDHNYGMNYNNVGWDFYDLNMAPNDAVYHTILMELFHYSPHIKDIDKILSGLVKLSKSINIERVFDVFSIDFTFRNLINWYIEVIFDEYFIKIDIGKAIKLTLKSIRND